MQVSLVAAALVGMGVVMALLWAVQRRTANAGIVDAAWSLGVGACGVLFAATADGDPTRRLVAGGLLALWSARLGVHILRRVLGEEEDGRYRRLRLEWGASFDRRLFVFFQLQAVFAVAFALPVLGVACGPAPLRPAQVVLAVAVWAVSVAGEWISDRQLAAFRSRPENRGHTCRVGLWRYSRHPNYFFEWVHWWSYVILGAGAPLWWLTAVGPIVMLFFLLKVTGVPATEARAASSRPDYREYQRTTSAFIPWFPRKGATRGQAPSDGAR